MAKKIRMSDRGSALLLVVILTLIIIGMSGAYLTYSLINSDRTTNDICPVTLCPSGAVPRRTTL